MDKFVICDVCMEVYDEGLRCPRVLTCGHSFCSSCIQKLLATSSCCPTCKLPIEEESLEYISINYVLKQMVEEFLSRNASDTSSSLACNEKECKTQPKVKSISSKGYCKLHKVNKRFRCMTCNMWICGDCSVISHKQCKILLIIEAIKEMKEENIDKITKHLVTISDGEVDSLNFLGHYEDILGIKNKELKCYRQKIIVLKEEIYEVNRNIEKVSDMQIVLSSLKEKFENQMKATNAASSANDLNKIEEELAEHFNSLKEFTEDLKCYKSCMLQNAENKKEDLFNNKKKLMASITTGERILVTENIDGITRYGELDVEEGTFRIHSMHQTDNEPSSLCITLDNCLITMTGWKEWPKKIFLQFSANGVPLGDVIIRLQESSKEATKTVFPSCLFGEEGRSFKGLGVRVGGRLCVRGLTNFIYSEGSVPFPSNVVRKALLKEKRYKWNEGEMGLAVWDGNNGMEFRFCIFVKESNEKLELIPAGQVEKGIEVIKDAWQRRVREEEVKLFNCGWALN